MNKSGFVEAIRKELHSKVKHNKLTVEKLASSFGITDKNLVKELTELAIVNEARTLAHSDKSVADRYADIVDLYKSQVNLSHRTSQSVLLQQYSTPAPIGYLMGVYCGIDKPGKYLEPSAGNGLLTIAADPQNFYVNEIDSVRLDNLKTQGFMAYSQQDATQPLRLIAAPAPQRQFDAVLTNPPFGKLDMDVKIDGYPIKDLDHLMTIRALDTMKDSGRAAIIVGGHTTWDEEGRVRQGKNRIFLNYLNRYYNVLDVILIDGHALYSRQGTAFDTRMILIDGRKEIPVGVAPLKSAQDTVVTTFDELYNRVMRFVNTQITPTNPMKLRLKLKAKALKLKLNGLNGFQVDEYYFDFIPEAKSIQEAKPELLIPIVKVELLKQRGSTFTNDNTGWQIELKRESIGKWFSQKIGDIKLKAFTAISDIVKVAIKTESDGNIHKFWSIVKVEGKIYPFGFIVKEENGKYLYHATLIPVEKIAKEKPSGLDGFLLSGSPKPFLALARYETPFADTKIHNLDANSNELAGCNCEDEDLGMPYIPAAQMCNSLKVDTPDSMGYETHLALKKLKLIVGNVEEYVQKKLGYKTHTELCKALSAEQTDAVALAIYNIEERKQALIVGDQTGIGKGRIAAAMIRYGRHQGMRPVFITEKPNLFSDLYRDLKAIGSETLTPYIVNSRESKTHVKDEDGTVVYQAPEPEAQKRIIDSGALPNDYDYVMLTYSQISGGEVDKRGNLIGKSKKGSWVERVSFNNIIVMDEAHNASGDSNTGKILQDIISGTKGVTFLSATFAKRPDNMPIYAMKTAMSEANMSKIELIDGIEKGGVALQEVLSAQLVQHGQMIRRERSYEGIEVNYITLDDKAEEHKAVADNITEIVRDIIAFQQNFVDGEVESLDKIAAKTNTGSNVEKRKGTKGAGVDSTPYFSKVFNVINQMLFSIKADAVADRAIMRLKEGKKPVIAFSSTMGSFIESMTDVDGQNQNEDGVKINADFATVLQKGLDGVLRYTERNEMGESVMKKFDVTELSFEAQAEYNRIADRIRTVSSGIVISPIDLIKQKLTKAGYRVAEVTGRKLEVELREAKADEDLPEIRIKEKGAVEIPANARQLIPPRQLSAIKSLFAGEEAQFFIDQVNKVDAIGQELKKRDLSRETTAHEKVDPSERNFPYNVAKPSLHYFNGSSDWYIYEWNEKEKTFYGFAVLNRDWQNAEFGYISMDELFANYGFGRTVELDLHFTPKPLNQLLELLSGLGKVTQKENNVKMKSRTIGLIKTRKKESANDAFRKFQNNEVDVLLINQSGSTGASAHALPTKLVKADQVKQRVMILLQAELDINTEVQKRGRINRTGQIYKPIYDYVFSAIPAEKRLMMMLQKKLKSLDANTTSNQKQSEAVLNVDDFLNKIGDRVVTNYLKDNPEINAMLDDPLNLADSEAETITEDAAHRVSGRVAVLPTELQEKFYNTLLQMYKDEVEYLKQIDEYDLEVDTLDLKAVTLEKSVKIVGKGGQSAFGDNTYLEKCEVNIIKKPYTITELDNLYKQALNGRTATDIKREYIDLYERAMQTNLDRELNKIATEYQEMIENITGEKKYQSLPPEAQSEYVQIRRKELTSARDEKMNKQKQKSENQSGTMRDFLDFFSIGRRLLFPLDMENVSSGTSMAVCLGVRIDLKNEKPFLPSNMKLQLAIASGKKRIDIPLSKAKDINAIRGASSNLFADNTWEEIQNLWQSAVKKTVGSDRGVVYIVTGNLLQSYGHDDFSKGRLISYTTADGKTLKGRLLPDGWEPSGVPSENLVKVPISKAVKVIASLTGGKSISTDNDTVLTKTYDDNFKIMVPASKSAGGSIYLDQELNEQMDNERFDKVSTFMVATFSASKLKKVIEILQRNHNASVGLLPYQLDLILDEVGTDKAETVSITEAERMEVDRQVQERKAEDERIFVATLPNANDESKKKAMMLRLKLKAKAVKVKLKLAA